MSSTLEHRGSVHVCTNNINITNKVIQHLYQKHCNQAQTIQKGVCSVDVNRQFIIVGSDEYVHAIFDPQGLTVEKTVTNFGRPSFCPKEGSTGPLLDRGSTTPPDDTIIRDMKTKLEQQLKTFEDNVNKLVKQCGDITDPADTDKLQVLQQLKANNESKKKETKTMLAQLKTLQDNKTSKEARRITYDTLHKQLYEAPPPTELPTKDADTIQTNRNSICRNRKKIPQFFPPGLYEAMVATKLPPVCLTMEDFMNTFSPGTMQVFANVVSKGLTLEEAKPAMPVSPERFFRNNPFFPRNRIRPLVTYPAEELDGHPRFRPLYNTVLVVADADNLNIIDPDAMEFLLKLVRHEPTCEAHYFISEMQNDDTAFLTNMCDSLRVPPLRERVDVEAYDVQSGRWAPVAVVQEEKGQMLVRFKDAVIQTGRARTFTVRPNLVRRWTRCDALTSPDMLRKFLKQHGIQIEAHVHPPELRSPPEDAASGKVVVEASDKAAVRCALVEKRYGDHAHTAAVRMKLRNIIDNLQTARVHGKLLVVAGDPCVGTYATTIHGEAGGDLSVLDLDKTASWEKMRRWAAADDARPGRLIVLVRKLAQWAELSSACPTVLKRRIALYVVARSVFEQSGIPRTLGIRHVYLMGNDVRLAVLSQSGSVVPAGAFGSLGDGAPDRRFTVVTVWKYIVSSKDQRLENNHAANTEALDQWSRMDNAPTFRLAVPDLPVGPQEGPEGLGTVMDAIQFLKTVDDEERRIFPGIAYTAHAKLGPTMQTILEALERPKAENFDPARILRTCKAWSDRVNLAPLLYDRVVAALQVILNGETYRSYTSSTRRSRCDDLRRRMAVHVALLQKILRESRELQRLTLSMRRVVGRSKGARAARQVGLRSKLLVLMDEGGAVDVVKLQQNASRSAELLAHVAAKQQMLDSARRATLLELGRLWDQFGRCPRSTPFPSGRTTGTKISFVPLDHFAGKAGIYSEALAAASDFQRLHGVVTDGGRGQVLLFNDLAAVLPSGAMLRGGIFNYLENIWGNNRFKNFFFRKTLKAQLRNKKIGKKLLSSIKDLGEDKLKNLGYDNLNKLIEIASKDVGKAEKFLTSISSTALVPQAETATALVKTGGTGAATGWTAANVANTIGYGYGAYKLWQGLSDGIKQMKDVEEFNKAEIEKIDKLIEEAKDPNVIAKLKEQRQMYYNESLAAEIKKKNMKKVVKKMKQAELSLPRRNYVSMDPKMFDNQHSTLTDPNLLGVGRGKQRHVQTLRMLSEGVQVALQPDVPPRFRFDPIVGGKAKLFLMHNLEVTQTMSSKRATSYRKYMQKIRIQMAEELGKLSLGSQTKLHLKRNWGKYATGVGAIGATYAGLLPSLGTAASAVGSSLPYLALTGTAATLAGVGVLGLGLYGAKKGYEWYQNRKKANELRRQAILSGSRDHDLLRGGWGCGVGGELGLHHLLSTGIFQAEPRVHDIMAQTLLTGGATAVQNAVVYVDPQRATLDSLVRMWEKGLSMAADTSPINPPPGTLAQLFAREKNPMVETLTADRAPSYMQVLLEQSKNCTSLNKAYLKGALKTNTFRCASEAVGAAATDDKTADLVQHDVVFVGSDGRSHTILWNVNPRVRVECSVLVSG